MSRINDLIKELCPNGVEYKLLKDVSEMKKGQSITTKNLKVGKIPVIAGGQEPSFYNDKYNRKGETITVSSSGAYAGFLNYWNEPILCTDSFSIKAKKLNMRYLYHYLKMKQNEIYNKKRGAGIPHVHISDLEKFKIPCPPLEVQGEIVRILDKFGELEAELEARKNQYEFWRGKLFDAKGKTKTYKLEEVLESLKTGLNPRKFFRLNTEDADGYYVTVREIGDRNVRYWESKDRVNKGGLLRINERANLEIGDVLFSGTGTIGRVSLIEETPDNWNVKEGVYILKPKKEIINPVYLMHLMRSDYMKKLYSDYIVGSPVSSVPMRDLKNVKFELPDLDTQEKISNILDKFDRLVNDITVGLPAEIELRRKQYEYYRNKLLNFEDIQYE